MRRRLSRSIAAVAAGAALAACGGASHPAAGAAAAAAGGGASADAVAVIRSWSQALARGDIAGAGAYFATPSRVQIAPGEPVGTVHSPAQARSVNLLLPCGAKLLDARTVDRYIDALFLLTRRPGADCGGGTGGTARVAFVIRTGKIVVWRRIADEAGDAARSVPGYHPPASPGPLPPRSPGALPPAARSV